MGEHLPYKQRVIGSSPIVPTTFGPVVQLVRTLACHARGRGFEPHPGRQFAFVAQLVEQRTENPRVVGSIPTEGTKRGFSSFGRAPPCQGGGSEFEPRRPLQKRSHNVGCDFFFWIPFRKLKCSGEMNSPSAKVLLRKTLVRRKGAAGQKAG